MARFTARRVQERAERGKRNPACPVGSQNHAPAEWRKGGSSARIGEHRRPAFRVARLARHTGRQLVNGSPWVLGCLRRVAANHRPAAYAPRDGHRANSGSPDPQCSRVAHFESGTNGT